MKLTISTLFLAAASFSRNAAASEYCSTLGAEFMRQQTAYFNPDGVFIAADGESKKHTPFVTVSDDGKSATVKVGNGDEEGGVWHPMTPSDDPNQVHWITHIMVKDQDGNFIVNQALSPTVEGPPTITFEVPDGVTSLTALEWW